MNQETRSILTSSMVGVIIGWVVGMAQLVYIGSWPFFYWAFMPLMPIYSALGGGLYGMIFGGGVFAARKKAETTAIPAPIGRGRAA